MITAAAPAKSVGGIESRQALTLPLQLEGDGAARPALGLAWGVQSQTRLVSNLCSGKGECTGKRVGSGVGKASARRLDGGWVSGWGVWTEVR